MSAFGWFIFGALVGWLIEFLIDFMFWRKACAERERSLNIREAALDNRDRGQADLDVRLKAREAEIEHRLKSFETQDAELRRVEASLAARRTDLEKQQAMFNETERSLAARMARVSSGESDVTNKMANVEQRATVLEAWEKRLDERDRMVSSKEANTASMAALVQSQYLTKTGDDDLEVVEGIGPKIAELLHAAGIHTFAQLAGAPVQQLRQVLETAGPRFALAKPETWPEQANLLARGDFVAFEKLKDELVGGVRKSDDGAAS